MGILSIGRFCDRTLPVCARRVLDLSSSDFDTTDGELSLLKAVGTIADVIVDYNLAGSVASSYLARFPPTASSLVGSATAPS